MGTRIRSTCRVIHVENSLVKAIVASICENEMDKQILYQQGPYDK